MNYSITLVCFLLLLTVPAAFGDDRPTDPRQKYERCRKECERQSEGIPQSKELCDRRCRQGRQPEPPRYAAQYTDAEEEKEQQNPYVFEDRHFLTGIQTRHGQIRILQKFTDKSDLLRGIENYRVAILEAQPNTFIVPNHFDADAVIFVVNGKGTVSMVREDKRESFNIDKGDIFKIGAGINTYLINRDNNQNLILAKLLRPVFTPDQFQAFVGGGGDNPESFYKVFSKQVLEAAFKTSWDRLERLFGQQKQGMITKMTDEQIREMSHHKEGGGGMWPFGAESKGPINIYKQTPVHSNNYGQHYEVDSSNYRPFKKLNLAVSLANISQGAMTGPLYNSRATKISIVVGGEGYFEMACPHLWKGGKHGGGSEAGTPRYRRVSGGLRRNTVVVVPAGHPFVAVASSKNENLQMLCFEVNAEENERYVLTGRGSVMKKWERQAKEAAFGVPAREVDEVLESQDQEWFFPGPEKQQPREWEREQEQEHKGHADA